MKNRNNTEILDLINTLEDAKEISILSNQVDNFVRNLKKEGRIFSMIEKENINPLQLAYLYANLMAYQAIAIQKRRFAFVQASMRGRGGIIARGAANDKPKTLEIDKDSIEKNLEPALFKAESEQIFPVFNTFDFKIYFSLVEISDGIATFLYPYHENIQSFDFDISDAENFWLGPNECMPLTVGIDEGTFDVEILYAKEPFHFRPKQSVPVAEYEAWKQTHANKIVFVKDGMRYIGEK